MAMCRRSHRCAACGERFQSRSGLYTHYLMLCSRREEERLAVKEEEEGDRIILSSASPSPLLPLLRELRGGVEGDVVVRSRSGGLAVAHRALLAATSPLLRQVLGEQEEWEEGSVVVVEEEQEEVDNLLDLLYTGTARQTQGLIQLLESLQVRK